MNQLIAICSEDAQFFLILSHILEVEGFASVLAGSNEDAFQLMQERKPGAVILDCKNRGFPAPTLCARLKQDAQTQMIPIAALVGSDATEQHIELLRFGVDESFTRPFTPAKLLDYLRSITSTARLARDRRDNRISLAFDDVEMRLGTYRVICGDREIRLAPIEFRLLRHLLESQDRVVSRDELISAAWASNVHVSTRTVDVHISRLRKSLKEVSKNDVIRTVRSAGYSLERR